MLPNKFERQQRGATIGAIQCMSKKNSMLCITYSYFILNVNAHVGFQPCGGVLPLSWCNFHFFICDTNGGLHLGQSINAPLFKWRY